MVNAKNPPKKRMSPVPNDGLIYVVLNTRGGCCIKDRWLTPPPKVTLDITAWMVAGNGTELPSPPDKTRCCAPDVQAQRLS